MCMVPLGFFPPSSKQEVMLAKGIKKKKKRRKPLNVEKGIGSDCKSLEV